jgi:cell wall-associated NlpC family hydrolase
MVTIVVGVAAPAFGAPVDDKRAQALAVKGQIDELDVQLELAAEQYNEAKSAYDDVSAKVAESEAKAAELTARQGELETHLATRVQGMYRQGPLGALEILLGAASFKEFAATWDLLQDMNNNDSSRVAELKRTRAELQTVLGQLATQQAEAKAQADAMSANKSAVEAQLAERQHLLSGIEAEIAEIQRQQEEAARRAAAAAAAAARARAPKPATDFGSPSGAAHGNVVQVALSKLGAPYRWAAAGPNAFDCSGFTMWCYAQVGIALPHSSRSQISVGERVSRDNLKPGDLVFFGSPIHHVGIYIGDGNFIHSPNTGDVVKITSLASRGDYVGACRP